MCLCDKLSETLHFFVLEEFLSLNISFPHEQRGYKFMNMMHLFTLALTETGPLHFIQLCLSHQKTNLVLLHRIAVISLSTDVNII